MTDTVPRLPPPPSPPERPLPVGACDSHAHVFGPFERFPLAVERSYTPPEASPEAHRAMLDAAGFDRGVVVQGSAHGTDNRAVVDALDQAPDRLRGVVVIDRAITDDELAQMASSGVRGARFTEIVSTRYAGGMKGVSNFEELKVLAPRLREHGLHAQVFASCTTIVDAAAMLEGLGVPVVVDHMAKIGPTDWDVSSPHYQSFLGMVRDGVLWSKLTVVRSARDAPAYEEARPFHDALVEANPDQLVFGSDWPLLNLGETPPDIGRLIDLFRNWVGDEALADRILVDNPARLYGFPPAASSL